MPIDTLPAGGVRKEVGATRENRRLSRRKIRPDRERAVSRAPNPGAAAEGLTPRVHEKTSIFR
jgi:hypothetical protein